MIRKFLVSYFLQNHELPIFRLNYDKVLDAAKFIESKLTDNNILFAPKVGIICGTGLSIYLSNNNILNCEWKTFLGILTLSLEQVIPCINYVDVPNYPFLSQTGHDGELYLGRQGNVDLLIFSGRTHCYQGYSLAQVTVHLDMDGIDH